MPDSNRRLAPEDGVSGLIDRVTFHSEETGFAVLRVKVKGKRELVTVVGSLPSVSAGEWVTAQGVWVQDREHGPQLKAHAIRCSPPTSREGIEKYLGSGLIKGIGPVYAKKLVEKFGEKVFTIIDQTSARLEEVDGIGTGRRKIIKAAWAEQKVVREIMVFLHQHGVSTSRATRIYKTYGDEAVEIVRSNPYRLARDIHGIGFKTADTIADKLGFAADSILRAKAGLLHGLSEATNRGHCALPRAALISWTRELLAVEESVVVGALERLLLDGEVIFECIGSKELLYLPGLRAAEERIATYLRSLGNQASEFPAIDADRALEWVQKRTGKALAATQVEAFRLALSSKGLVITGGPGVGKTTLIQSILHVLVAKKRNCLLCAPTGRAAKRLSEASGLPAKTIHRLLEAKAEGFGRNASHPLDCDVLVVDESSMIDVVLFSRLVQALPRKAHLILVGDVDQLPSVGPGLVLADILRSGVLPVVRLTEIFRQAASSAIVTNAHRINTGQLPEASTSPDSDFFFLEREEPEAIQKAVLEMVANRIPKKLGLHPIHDIQVLCPMNRGPLGTHEMNRLLQNALNPERLGEPFVEKFGVQFRLRDKVLQTRNNYDKETFNGDIGIVTRIDPAENEVGISFDGREVAYDFHQLDELSPAYAITIHKSQGSEFPAVVLPVAMSHYVLLQRNLLYTGMTRGKRLVVITGQKKAMAHAVSSKQAAERHSALLERLSVREPGL